MDQVRRTDRRERGREGRRAGDVCVCLCACLSGRGAGVYLQRAGVDGNAHGPLLVQLRRQHRLVLARGKLRPARDFRHHLALVKVAAVGLLALERLVAADSGVVPAGRARDALEVADAVRVVLVQLDPSGPSGGGSDLRVQK